MSSGNHFSLGAVLLGDGSGQAGTGADANRGDAPHTRPAIPHNSTPTRRGRP